MGRPSGLAAEVWGGGPWLVPSGPGVREQPGGICQRAAPAVSKGVLPECEPQRIYFQPVRSTKALGLCLFLDRVLPHRAEAAWSVPKKEAMRPEGM